MTSDAGASCGYFLSYSRSDEKFALRLAQDLRAGGIAMWIDQLDIRPSEHWDRAIERAVRECRGLVVVLSPRSVASDNVADEISFAIDSGKSVLPVMIERCTLPLRLTRMQVIDATGDYGRALKQCHDELARREGLEPKPATQPRQPLDPAELKIAEERLATILGPIAGPLTEKAAVRAHSTDALYRMLADHIPDEAERTRFLALGPGARETSAIGAKGPSEIPAAELETLSQLMTRYIGPIAPMVVKRESRSCASAAELRGALSLLIASEPERAEFLRQAQAR